VFIPIKKKFKRLRYFQFFVFLVLTSLGLLNRNYLLNAIGLYHLYKASQQYELESQWHLEESKHYFEKALRIDSTFAPAYANLASLTSFNTNEEKFERGQHYFKKAIGLCADDVDLYILAFDHIVNYFPVDSSIDLALADSMITLAAHMDPKNSETLVHLAMYQANLLGQYEQAISNIEMAARFRDEFDFLPHFDKLYLYHRNLDLSNRLSELAGQVYFARQKYQGVQIPSESQLDWIPRKDNFYLGLAKEFTKGEDYHSALKYLAIALKYNPHNSYALKESATIHYFIGDYESAIEMYQAALKNVIRDKGFLYSDLAFTYKQNGEYDKSISTFEKAIKNGFPKRMGYYNIASIYALRGNKKSTLEYLRKAIRRDESFRHYSTTDSSFMKLWNDSDFVHLTKITNGS